MLSGQAASSGYRQKPLWTALACVLIVASGIAAWSNSFHGPPIFDDAVSIQSNPTLKHFPDWQNLAPPQVNPLARRPIVNFTFAINYALGWPDVSGFHVVNLLVHLGAALALFGIVRRTLATEALRERFGRAATPLGVVVALLWMLHPLQTESVTYLTQRTESLMGLFYLLTLYGVIRGASSKRPWRWYCCSVAACALGTGTKEVMATAPLVVLLYDRGYLAGSFREALRKRLGLYLALAGTWAILGALLFAYPEWAAGGAGFGIGTTPWQYACTQPEIILQYLKLSLWPHPLVLDYGWRIATDGVRIAATGAAVAALTAGTIWALSRAPKVGFLGAWVFLILAPTSSIVPMAGEVIAERRMYLPLAAIVAGIVLALSWLAERSARGRTRWRRAAVAAALAVAGMFGWLTYARNVDYQDEMGIWKDTVAKRPDNAHALTILGILYGRKGDRDMAFHYFNEAIRRDSRCAEAYNSRGVAFAEIAANSEAIEDFSRAMEYNRGHFIALRNRADIYVRTGRIEDALSDYLNAIKLSPSSVGTHINLGTLYATHDRPDLALTEYNKVIELLPEGAVGYANRAGVYVQLGRFDAAVRDCDRAITLEPDFPNAYLNRAYARAGLGSYEDALRDLAFLEQRGVHAPAAFVDSVLKATGRMK
jgi:protein O-mannosyl-transferase